MGKRRNILFYVLLAFTSLLIVVFCYMSGPMLKNDDITKLDGGWDVYINGELEYTNQTLSELELKDIDKGDRIEISSVFPQNLNYEGAEFVVEAEHSTFEMFIDGELVYEYGVDRYNAGKYVGSGYHKLYLDKDAAGKTITLVYCIAENNAVSELHVPELYIGQDYSQNVFNANVVEFIIGSFLVVFGFIMELISCILLKKAHKFARMFYAGMFSMAIGVWTVCYSQIVSLFDSPPYLLSSTENVALFITIIPIMGYFYYDMLSLKSRKWTIIYNGLWGIEIIFFVVATVLHFTDIRHYKQSLTVLHIHMLLSIIVVCVCVVKGFRKSNSGDRLRMIGIVVAAVSVIVDLVIYNTGIREMISVPFTALGTLILVSTLFISIVYDTLDSFLKEAENKVLKKFAYTDELTGVGNRHACEEKLEAVTRLGGNEYGIVSIDLNDLKLTNDSLGHNAGDMLIKSFAGILKEYFGEYGFVGRMGGDEFLVVIDNTRACPYEEVIKRINKEMKDNASNNAFKMTASFGYAKAEAMPGKTALDIYKEADSIMYNNKRQFKEKRQ